MTKDEITAALTIHRRVERLRAQLEDIEATGGVASPNLGSPVQGGAGISGAAMVAAELAAEIAQLEQELRIEQEITRRGIEKAPELAQVEARLLLLRYVRCRPWHLVCRSLGYSKSHVLRLHATALEKMIPKETS